MTGSKLSTKVDEFLSDRKYSNNLMDILSHLDKPEQVQPDVLFSIQRLFDHVLQKKTMFMDKFYQETDNLSAEDKYKIWLRDCYKECFKKVLHVLDNGNSDSQVQALVTCMHLVQLEAKNPINKSKSFPVEKLMLVIKHLISNPFSSVFVARFKEYLGYLDILFYSFKSLSNLLSDLNFLKSEEIVHNTISFIKEFPLPNQKDSLFPEEISEDSYLCTEQSNSFDLKQFCNFVTNVWLRLSNFKQHSNFTVKSLLLILIDKIMFYHSNPMLITDFLVNALNFKGPVAVLSLQGMVNLVQKYNLEYPNIYNKLYSLLEPSIFYTKYKARLFYLIDLLMMSTHLPEVLVASFIKKLCRLCLIAPPQDIAIMIYLIGNLVLRHKGLMILFENESNISLENDPYDENEADPYMTNSLKSSLWELKILQNHPLYCVNVPARFINNPLPNVEWDLGKYLEETYDDIFLKEFKKKQKNLTTNFEKPNSMFLPKNSQVFNSFSLL